MFEPLIFEIDTGMGLQKILAWKFDFFTSLTKLEEDQVINFIFFKTVRPIMMDICLDQNAPIPFMYIENK